MPRVPAIEDLFTIEPPPAARIGAIAFLTPHHVPTRLTWSMRSSPSSDSFSIEPT
jgi:hypothetical protein